MAQRVDKELEEFRRLMDVPDTFHDGFSWKSLFGAIFIALLMVPGAIYMDLLAGQGIGPSAQWVTVILFVEVARRAQSALKKADIFILYYMAGAAVSMPFFGLLWNQFFARSQAAQANGITTPYWFAPAASSVSYANRTFFHADWLPVIGMVVFTYIFSQLNNLILGYGLFRLTSDIERLPFPMAPVGAQGILALAEDTGEKAADDRESNWRWRIFSIGGALGLVSGTLYTLVPLLSSAVLTTPIQLFTIPFVDTTAKTQSWLPAVATGYCWDFGQIIVGMILPFFAIVGSALGLLFTLIANPLLYKAQILNTWAPGDDTITTLFKNNIDFYFSFGIGISLAVAVIGVYQVVKSVREKKREFAELQGDVSRITTKYTIPKERGDIKPVWIFFTYFLVTSAYIAVSMYLLLSIRNFQWDYQMRNVLYVLLLLGFIYTPAISYVTARLEGMAGQMVDIPMVKEASLIMSGYRGAEVWFLPIPISNLGAMTVSYRVCELTGTTFYSKWKAQLILMPIILISSLFFMNFIWHLADVPSPVYPFAQKMWDLNAANNCIMYSSTMGEYSQFEQAFSWQYVLFGTGIGVALFSLLTAFGAPIFLIYGVVRGLSNAMPHFIIPQFIGALIGRFYFQKKLGVQWRQYIPVVAAGFFVGAGLVTVLGIGIKFMKSAVISLPF